MRLFKNSALCIRWVLTIGVSFGASVSAGAADLIEGFETVANLSSNGWSLQNLSNPLGVTNWFQGTFAAQAGPTNSYLSANFNNSGSNGTISNWAITPTLTYQNGDTFSFYTKSFGFNFPDRLEVRFSTNGASSDVGSTATSVGDFTNLLLEINPTIAVGGYPTSWTQYVLNISGLAGPTSGRIAFRYFVTNAGPGSPNGDLIGIDTLQITTAVPEPSTYVLGILGAGMLGLARRRVNRLTATA